MRHVVAALAVGIITLAFMFTHQAPTETDRQTVAFLAGIMGTLTVLGAPGYLRVLRRLEEETRIMRTSAGPNGEHRR